MLRIRTPYDLDFLGRTSENIDRSVLSMLPSLDIGEVLLVGEAINFPVFFRIRRRNNNFSDDTPSFEEMAENFELG
jgi:DNA helicase HerA-like ATPase